MGFFERSRIAKSPETWLPDRGHSEHTPYSAYFVNGVVLGTISKIGTVQYQQRTPLVWRCSHGRAVGTRRTIPLKVAACVRKYRFRKDLIHQSRGIHPEI